MGLSLTRLFYFLTARTIVAHFRFRLWIILLVSILPSLSLAEFRCIELFLKPNVPLRYEFMPVDEIPRFLDQLGLVAFKEEKGKLYPALTPKHRWAWFDTPTERVLREFQAKWNIHLYYSNQVDHRDSPDKINSLLVSMTNSDQVAGIYIPIPLLENPTLLREKLAQMSKSLAMMEKFKSLGVEIIARIHDTHLTLKVVDIPQNTKDPFLLWMRKRMERHNLSFKFSSMHDEPMLIEAGGFARGENVVLQNEAIQSGQGPAWLTNEFYRNALAHEIVHATNFALYQKGHARIVGKMIEFIAINGDNGLTEQIPEHYRKRFRSDELEAWATGAHFQTGEARETTIKTSHLFLVQLKWLQALQQQILNQGVDWTQASSTHYKSRLSDLRYPEMEIQIPLIGKIKSADELKQNVLLVLTDRISQLENFASTQSIPLED